MIHRCTICGITEKGAAGPNAITSPSGMVHLMYLSRTFCGKKPTKKWRPGGVST